MSRLKRIYYASHPDFPYSDDHDGETYQSRVLPSENTGLPVHIHIVPEEHLERFKEMVTGAGGTAAEATQEALQEEMEIVMVDRVIALNALDALMELLFMGALLDPDEEGPKT